MTTLYHYCCSHSATDIRREGVLRSGADVCADHGITVHEPQGHLVWLTDMFPPDRNALGLTMYQTNCDRMTHCFTVDSAEALAWRYYRRLHPEMKALELEPGVLPMHWWVATGPLTVTGEVAR